MFFRNYRPVAHIILLLVSLAPAVFVWVDDDGFPGDGTAPVNEGTLVLLAARPAQPVHEHSNRIVLDDDSLQHGWARLEQCHRNIDPVERAQVVYNDARVRALRVTRSEGIGEARVDGASVQLLNVSKAAQLCIQAESRVVHWLDQGRFAVRNGPFMRNFLDGYYPMHVQLEVILPPGEWKLEKTRPVMQPGFVVRPEQDRIYIDAWFSGRLETELVFRAACDGAD